MKKHKPSGPEIFMNFTMVIMAVLSVVAFCLYYFAVFPYTFVLWIAVVSFMILYHFWLRIFFGKITSHFDFDYRRSFFQKKPFEKFIFKFVHIRKWKDKVLTFDPQAYDFKNRTYEELAKTMCKSETDHWINEGISIVSMFFGFLWGCFPAFIISGIIAMLFDLQFILVQRYNRPILIRLLDRKKKKEFT